MPINNKNFMRKRIRNIVAITSAMLFIMPISMIFSKNDGNAIFVKDKIKFEKNLLNRILEILPKELYEKIYRRFIKVALANNNVKIYDGKSYAQGFYPYIENLTRIELPISVEEKKKSASSSLKKISGEKHTSKGGFARILSDDEELGDLIVSICSDRNRYPGDVILSKRFTVEEVKGNGKVVWELEKEYTLVRPADDPYWQEHGLEPKNEGYGRKLYYIVATAEGGYDEEKEYCYYVWEQGAKGTENSNARDGSAYFKNESRWEKFDWEYKLKYAIYGKLAWEKPGDGIENHYGVFVTPSSKTTMDKIKKWASLFKGEKKIVTDPKPETPPYELELIWEALDLIDAKSDADDVVVFFILGDGWYQWLSGVTARAVAERFERMNVKGICAIFSACHTGSFVEYFKEEGWDGIVVLSSCSKDEEDRGYDVNDEDWPSALVYFMYEYMKEAREKRRKVTAEKAFEYVEEKTRGWPNLHPQMYDAYPNKENNKEELEI